MQQKELTNEAKINNLSDEIIKLKKQLDEHKVINSKEVEFRNKEFNEIKKDINKIMNDNTIDNKIENIATNTTTCIVDQ